MIKPLKHWLSNHTAKQREALANRAGTSPAYLYQLAVGIRTLTVEVAAKIEQATRTLRRSNRKTHTLDRTELSPVCRRCPHIKK